jgi:hypothetical protein
MIKNIHTANRLIIMGYLIPLTWFLVILFIELKFQNEAKHLGNGIVVFIAYMGILFYSFFSLFVGSIVSVWELLLKKELRITMNLFLATFGIMGVFIIGALVVLFLCF